MTQKRPIKLPSSSFFFILSACMILMLAFHHIFISNSHIMPFYLIIIFCLLMALTFLMNFTKEKFDSQVKCLFSLGFCFSFLEIFEYGSVVSRAWVFILYLMIVQENIKGLTEFLGISSCSIYFFIKGVHDGQIVVLIMIFSLNIVWILAKYQNYEKFQRKLGALSKEVSELREFKECLLNGMEANLILIRKASSSKTESIYSNILGQTRKKILCLVKKKKVSCEKTTPSRPKKHDLFATEISHATMKQFGDLRQKNNFEGLMEEIKFDHFSDKLLVKPDGGIANNIQEINRETEKDKFEEILSQYFLTQQHSILPSSLSAKNIEFQVIPLRHSVLLLEKEKLETLKRNAETKERLLASVSHDMRSPLNGIIFYIKSAQEEQNEVLRAQKLNYAKINTQLLLFLVNDILDYSRNQKGGLSLNFSQFSLQQTLEEVYMIMRMDAVNKGISLIIKNDCQKNLCLFSDEVRLKQILLNFLTNAIKFTFQGFVKLHVAPLLPYENLIKFEISDTGLGIRQEVMPLLTKPFATFDLPDRQINRNGIGLGLFICKTLSGALGPEKSIFIHSEIGKGSKFGFVCYIMHPGDQQFLSIKSSCESPPLKASPQKVFDKSLESFREENLLESELRDSHIKTQNISSNAFYNRSRGTEIIKSRKFSLRRIGLTERGLTFCSKVSELGERGESNTYKTKKKSILIVDDNFFNLMILYEMLTTYPDSKLNVEKATNGKMAVELFESHNAPTSSQEPFDLIFMDCEMPLMNGIEAAKFIRKKILLEGYLDLKMIACTGDLIPSKTREQNLMDDWITKPVDKETIFKCIKKYL